MPQSSSDRPGEFSAEQLTALQAALDAGHGPALLQACAQALMPLRQQLRMLLAYHLDDAPLRTREVLRQVQQLIGSGSALQAPRARRVQQAPDDAPGPHGSSRFPAPALSPATRTSTT